MTIRPARSFLRNRFLRTSTRSFMPSPAERCRQRLGAGSGLAHRRRRFGPGALGARTLTRIGLDKSRSVRREDVAACHKRLSRIRRGSPAHTYALPATRVALREPGPSRLPHGTTWSYVYSTTILT